MGNLWCHCVTPPLLSPGAVRLLPLSYATGNAIVLYCVKDHTHSPLFSILVADCELVFLYYTIYLVANLVCDQVCDRDRVDCGL